MFGRRGSLPIWRDLIAGVDLRLMIYKTASAGLAAPVLFVASSSMLFLAQVGHPAETPGPLCLARGIDITSGN